MVVIKRHMKNTRPPVVWVTARDNTKDYSDAERFGALQFVEASNENHRAAAAILPDFQPQDFVIFIGHPVRVAVCGHAIFAKCQRVKILIWDWALGSYYVQDQSI